MASTDISKKVNPPKTRKGKKILESKEPLLIENDKKTVILKGANTSGIINDVLTDIFKIRRHNAVMTSKNNPFLPFEEASGLCELLKKKDSSLFVFGSHNKKRPHNLVFGRTFDGQILDMIEFGVTSFKKLSQFKPTKVPLGAKPVLIFNGDMFERSPEWGIIQNYFLDFFCTTKTNSINLQGLEYVISISGVEPDLIHLRSYEVNMKKSGTDTPFVELVEIGVSLDLKLRRTQFAAQDVRKKAMKIPRAAKIGKTKNIAHDMAGSKLATVHMTKQDIAEMPQSRMKGTKTKRKEGTSENKSVKKVKNDEEANPENESMDTS